MLLIDFFRVVAVINAAMIGLMSLYLSISRRYSLDLGHKLRFLGVTLFALFVCLMEGGQIGRPFIWWRLPLITLINVVFSFGLLLGTRTNWGRRARRL